MFKYEGEPVWEETQSRFTRESIDPVSGVKTSWYRYPISRANLRTDESPSIYSYRSVGEHWDDNNERILENTCRVIAEEDMYKKSVNIEYDYENGIPHLKEFVIGIAPSQVDQIDLAVESHYTERGRLRFIVIDIRPQESASADMPQGLDGKLFHFFNRPLEDNIKELGELYRYVGYTAFGNPDADDTKAENDYNMRLLILKGVTRKWSQETRDRMVEFVASSSDALVNEWLADFSDDEKEAIIKETTIETMQKVALRFPNLNFRELSIMQRVEMVKTALRDSTAGTLAFYYQNLMVIGYSKIKLEINEGDDNKIDISVEDTEYGKPPVYTEQIGLEDDCNFEHYVLRVARNRENEMQLFVNSKTRPNFGGRLDFPDNIDIEKIHTLATISLPTGWEGALNLVATRYIPNKK